MLAPPCIRNALLLQENKIRGKYQPPYKSPPPVRKYPADLNFPFNGALGSCDFGALWSNGYRGAVRYILPNEYITAAERKS